MPACCKELIGLLPTDLTGTKRVRANLLLLTQRCVFGFALTCIVFNVALCPSSQYLFWSRIPASMLAGKWKRSWYIRKPYCFRFFGAFLHTCNWKFHLQKRCCTTCITMAKTSEYSLNLPIALPTSKNSDSLSSIHEVIRTRQHTLSTQKRPVVKVL